MRRTSLAIVGGAALALSVIVTGMTDGAHAGSRENFISADRNRDGALTRSEFRNFINKDARDNVGYAVSIRDQNRYNDAFDMVDTNGDGKFSREEAQGAPGQSSDASIR